VLPTAILREAILPGARLSVEAVRFTDTRFDLRLPGLLLLPATWSHLWQAFVMEAEHDPNFSYEIC
jgi:hypothetical protein